MTYNRFYIFIVFIFALFAFQCAKAQVVAPATPIDSIAQEVSDSMFSNAGDSIRYTYNFLNFDGSFKNEYKIKNTLDSLVKTPISYSDSLLFQTNPLLAPLVFMGKKIAPIQYVSYDQLANLNCKKDTTFSFLNKKGEKFYVAEKFIHKLRGDILTNITRTRADLFTSTYDELPDLNTFKQRYINNNKPLTNIYFEDKKPLPQKGEVKMGQVKKLYWRKKARALFQFSQNYISSNWYQGGSSNLALLSVLSGQIVYDNMKNVQWENNLEWRAGFNSVEGDTLRSIAANDDLLRYTTKFGIKAFGNWFYSISGEASTQLFDNYKAVNSTVFKARLLTPLRANIGVGMDYQYKKLLSLMIAPVSFKYIYANDVVHVNPNNFGIKKGENHLSEIGSSFKAQISYSPLTNWQLDSRLTFFTNYKKVETDWEIVNNFTFNRFLSARLMLNPRYDNTVIEKNGVKARIQFKQLLSLGLSLRLI